MQKILSFFNRRYYLFLFFPVLSLALIFWDIFSLFFAKRVPFYSHTFSEIAELSVLIAIFLASYYLYREVYIYSIKRWGNSLHSTERWLKLLLYFLRDLHPSAGIVAISLLLVHGSFFNFVYYGGVLNATTLSGFAAFTLLFAQGVTGISIKRWGGYKKFRYLHRIVALLFFAALLFHTALT